MKTVFAFLCVLVLPAFVAGAEFKFDKWRQYEANPFEIEIEVPPPGESSAGSIITADADNDGLADYLFTAVGYVACYGHDGKKLWVKKGPVCVAGSSETYGLPGHHGPGVTAGDIDGDGRCEVLHLDLRSGLHVLNGATGAEKWACRIPAPKGAERWEHLVIANFRGKGDRDLLLQATNADGYRMGRYVAAFSLKDLRKQKTEPLWARDDFLACAHNGARVADLNTDGRDEVLGGTIVSPEGKILYTIPLKGHIDSIFVYDVRPDLPGLEVVALEEGNGQRVFLFKETGLVWETDYQHWEPQNAAVGEFAPDRPGLEVWCRSRFPEHQQPFVFDAQGKMISAYEMDKVAPQGWTIEGVETINVIDWTGDARQCAAAKERHMPGDLCVFNGLTGEFIKTFNDKCDRLYVADVSGDWREELISLSGSTLRIYHNPAPNPAPDKPRLWHMPHYARSKKTWNYYSP